MRYKIEYEYYYGGASYLNPNDDWVEPFKTRLIEHIPLFNQYFNKWAFTGSSALVIYASDYPNLISKLKKPNDIDIIVETDDMHIPLRPIGNYRIQQTTLEKTATFINNENESIDVLYEKKIKKIEKDNIPLININFLYHSYDDLGRPDDRVKQEVLNEIIKIRTTATDTETTPIAVADDAAAAVDTEATTVATDESTDNDAETEPSKKKRKFGPKPDNIAKNLFF